MTFGIELFLRFSLCDFHVKALFWRPKKIEIINIVLVLTLNFMINGFARISRTQRKCLLSDSILLLVKGSL